jgi:hypothetical protein
MRRVLRIAAAACLLTVTLATPTAAAKPEMEKVPIDDVHVLDPFLTDVCGFDVFVDAHGHITFRLFLDDGVPQRELDNFAIRLTYSSAWGSVGTVDVGADRVTFLDDGSVLRVVIGNVQSLVAKGEGRVFSDVGQMTFLITFDEEGNPITELVGSHGQHDGDIVPVICALLAP